MAKRKVFDSFDSTPTGPTVAQTLRDARLAMGHELRDVATMLRIRYPYLQAIEDGRYQDLPGSAYAAGFLRSYAEYLGLDPVDIVARYKAEAAGAMRDQELYLPTPATEERIPGGTLLLLTLILAGAVYGGWYYLSATDRSMADLVPRLPDRLVSLLDALPTKSGGPTSAADSAPAAPVQAPVVANLSTAAAPPVPPLVSGSTVTAPLGAPAPAAHGTMTTTTAPATPGANGAATAASATSAAAANAAAAAAAALPPSPAAPVMIPPLPTIKPTPSPVVASAADDEDSESSPQEPTPLAAAATAQAASAQAAQTAANAAAANTTGANAARTPAEPANPNAKVYGMQNQNPKLIIKATQESWLQIRDGNEIVFTRVLKPGDTYRVPDKVGVRIRTGNAGGLVVVADGAESQPLGSVGMVLRDVPIDASGVVKSR
ncbi:helix-turn-helix domain-containing protein [Azospirillum griseum]|uniref:Helix-turn-helix domain-containing protein n=2 Tax=Azospirillum griseum TaxID=2496639 RepID=A0A431VH66_9PROT|nr:helix-turn-helix domain-containing protein [Azospirillum griseum]RTR19803.1 helix-turn-helix domain-containing protein [Azospirillum griseum]